MRRSESCCPSREPVLPRRRDTTMCPEVRSTRHGDTRGGRPGVVPRLAPTARSFVETTGSPRFLDSPSCSCPALRPRQDLGARPSRPSDIAFRSSHDVGSCKSLFGALSRSLSTPCERLTTPVARSPRITRFRLVVSLGRLGIAPTGCCEMFPCLLHFRTSQAWPGARPGEKPSPFRPGPSSSGSRNRAAPPQSYGRRCRNAPRSK